MKCMIKKQQLIYNNLLQTDKKKIFIDLHTCFKASIKMISRVSDMVKAANKKQNNHIKIH